MLLSDAQTAPPLLGPPPPTPAKVVFVLQVVFTLDRLWKLEIQNVFAFVKLRLHQLKGKRFSRHKTTYQEGALYFSPPILWESYINLKLKAFYNHICMDSIEF